MDSGQMDRLGGGEEAAAGSEGGGGIIAWTLLGSIGEMNTDFARNYVLDDHLNAC